MFDNETQAAVKAKWNAATIDADFVRAKFPDLVGILDSRDVKITDLIVGGLKEEPINIDGNLRPQYLYAGFDVLPDGKTNQVSAGGGEIDFRRLKLSIYGVVQETVANAMRAVNAAFDEQSLDIENAEWMRTESIPENHGRLEKADKANADSFWKGILEFRVWSSRQKAPIA